jgi:hypothetical protein
MRSDAVHLARRISLYRRASPVGCRNDWSHLLSGRKERSKCGQVIFIRFPTEHPLTRSEGPLGINPSRRTDGSVGWRAVVPGYDSHRQFRARQITRVSKMLLAS